MSSQDQFTLVSVANMKWIYTLPSLAFLQFAASSHNIDFVPITTLDADVVENSRTYIPVGNGAHAWSPATAHLITENALTDAEGAHFVAEINAAADYGSKGLRELSSNYEQVATDVERKRCDFSSGSRLDLTSVSGGSLNANENVAKLVWQVKELALMVKLGQVKKRQFSVLNENMIKCINHLPGRHNNLKEKVSRDMAIFESVFNRKIPGQKVPFKPADHVITFKSVSDQSFTNYGEYYASNHGKTVYNHLFMNSNLTNLPDTLATSLKDKFDTFNCAHARSTILSSAGWADFERFALQVAFGEASTCEALVTTFYEASLSIMTELNTLNAGSNGEDGTWGTADDLELRQLAYDTALNAITQKNKDVSLVDAMVSMSLIYLILFVVFLAILTVLGRNDRMMIDKLQDREDEMNSKPVKRMFGKAD